MNTAETRENGREPRGKAAVLCERLSEMARERRPGGKMPTVRELCAQLETTPATLSLALARLEAEGVLRRRQGSGIFIAQDFGRRRLGLVCDPSFFGGGTGLSPFWNILVERVQERARAGEEELSFHFALPSNGADGRSSAPPPPPPLHEGLVASVRAGRVHGALGVGLSQRVADWFAAQGVPLVSFAGPGCATVGADYAAMITLLVETLTGQGARKIELWSPVSPYRPAPSPLPADYERNREAFARAVSAAGLAFDPVRHRYRHNGHLIARAGGIASLSHVEQGYETALAAFGPGTPPAARPDGVVLLDDMMTLGALQALDELGVRVGRDVRIGTHANAGSPVLMGWEGRLSCAEVDPAQIVEAMFRLLEALIDGRELVTRRVLLRPFLRLHAGLSG